MKVLFITRYDEQGASSRCRVYQYLPCLAARGIEGEILPRTSPAADLGRRAGAADVVFLQKRVLTLGRLLLLRRRARLLVFDFDDAIWLRRRRNGTVCSASLRTRLRLAATLRLADAVVAGNQYLARYARRWNPRVTVLPTPIDSVYYELEGANSSTSREGTAHTPLYLGWVGHPSNLCYLRRLDPILAALSYCYPCLSLRVICSKPYDTTAIPVQNVSWTLADEVVNLRGLDIGLMPLDDDPWTRGKCGYKALQYMAAGVPVVCSPVGMNSEIVTEGRTGLLAAEDDAWVLGLSRLIESAALRHRLGAAGQQLAMERYSLAVMGPRLADLLESLHETGALRPENDYRVEVQRRLKDRAGNSDGQAPLKA